LCRGTKDHLFENKIQIRVDILQIKNMSGKEKGC